MASIARVTQCGHARFTLGLVRVLARETRSFPQGHGRVDWQVYGTNNVTMGKLPPRIRAHRGGPTTVRSHQHMPEHPECSRDPFW